MIGTSGYAYRCSAGETFDSVALAVYGDEKYACELMKANPELVTKSVFDGTELINLPVVETPDEETQNYGAANAPWKE